MERSVPSADMVGLSAPASHDQVLRNHAVGKTCRVSVFGPAFVTSISISRSVGLDLA
jgi:hypothetical protein